MIATFSTNESAPARIRSQGALYLFSSKAKDHNSNVHIYVLDQAIKPA